MKIGINYSTAASIERGTVSYGIGIVFTVELCKELECQLYSTVSKVLL